MQENKDIKYKLAAAICGCFLIVILLKKEINITSEYSENLAESDKSVIMNVSTIREVFP